MLKDKKTNGDRIRSMTDEQICDFLMKIDAEYLGVHFCQNKTECEELLESLQITDAMCRKCMLEWLKKVE